MRQAGRPALRRIVAIDRAIRAGEYPNAVTIGEQLEVAPRTVQRDIEFMRDSLGAPLAFSRRHNGYEYFDPGFELPYFKLTEGELVSLFVAEQALRQYRGTPYEADLTRAFRKLAVALPDEITIDLNAVGQTHSFRTSATTLHDLETFRRLAAATIGRERLRLTYWTASRDAVTRRVVDPYHLANVDGDWFLIAYCHLREDVRMFSPARIRKLERTGETFTPPAEFSIARYLDGAFRVIRDSGTSGFEVRLRFTPGAAKYIREKLWHPTQTLVERPDGSVELTLRVAALLEVRRWAMSFGSECEVLEPAELREEVRAEMARMGATYARPARKKRVKKMARAEPTTRKARKRTTG